MTDSDVRVALYRDFVAAGRAPAPARLAQILNAPVDEIRAALERLAAGRAIVLQPVSREILFAAPLSAVPTPFVVHVGGRALFAPCAWDALAVIAMLKTNGAVETSCPCCGESMSIEVRGGRPLPATGIVHFALPAKQWWQDIVFT